MLQTRDKTESALREADRAWPPGTGRWWHQPRRSSRSVRPSRRQPRRLV